VYDGHGIVCEHGVLWPDAWPGGCTACQEQKDAALGAEAFACQIAGHTYEDNGSYAGPDSAEESFACRYCGWTWSVVLY
jgi:hypothetical protein